MSVAAYVAIAALMAGIVTVLGLLIQGYINRTTSKED